MKNPPAPISRWATPLGYTLAAAENARAGIPARRAAAATGAATHDGAARLPAVADAGWVAEWLKALVLKTSNPQGFVGSNPTPSAIR